MSRSVWMVMARNPVYDGGDDVVSVHGSRVSAEKYMAKLRRRIDKAEAADEEWSEKVDAHPDTPYPGWPDDVPQCESLHVSGAWTVRR